MCCDWKHLSRHQVALGKPSVSSTQVQKQNIASSLGASLTPSPRHCPSRLARARLYSALPLAKPMDAALPCDCTVCTTWKPLKSLLRASRWLEPVT